MRIATNQPIVGPVAGGFVLEADAGDGVGDVFAGLGRHQRGLLDPAHGRGHVAGQDALHHDALAGVLDPQVLREFVNVRLQKQFLIVLILFMEKYLIDI
jgi:hypothetical protein